MHASAAGPDPASASCLHAAGFFPVAIYARRARKALPEALLPGVNSWDILGTNLSVKVGPQYSTEQLLCHRHRYQTGRVCIRLAEGVVLSVLPALAARCHHSSMPCKLTRMIDQTGSLIKIPFGMDIPRSCLCTLPAMVPSRALHAHCCRWRTAAGARRQSACCSWTAAISTWLAWVRRSAPRYACRSAEGTGPCQG